MTNPVVTAVAKGGWVKVATNVTCVSIWVLKPGVYGWTYRDTAGAAPTLMAESSALNGSGRTFASGTAFDLYLWKSGSEDGSVRVDEDFQAEYLIDA